MDWTDHVERVRRKYRLNKTWKFGLRRAYPVLDYLCENETVAQEDLVTKFRLSMDDLMSILANVTMSIQDNGDGVAS